MDRDEYLKRWSGLHGGVAPQGLVGGWLRFVHAVAAPFARRGLGPNAVTALGLVIAVAGLPLAAAGWLPLAVLTVALSGLCDSLDGALAVIGDRVTRRGAVLDAVCDRVADLCLVGTLWLAGAPGPVCVAAAVVAGLHEYLRAEARVAGMSEVGVVTVAERPTRVIVTAMFLLAAAIPPAGTAAQWAGAGAAALATIGAVGLVHLAVVVRRHLA